MKYFSCLFFMIFVSCGLDKNPTAPDLQGLPGTWQLVESAYSIGGPIITEQVENGKTITFSTDMRFVTHPEEDCGRGTYQINKEELILNVICNSGERKTLYYKVTFDQDSMKMVPTNPMCVEGCWTIYKKSINMD